jgi:hypothetical protein
MPPVEPSQSSTTAFSPAATKAVHTGAFSFRACWKPAEAVHKINFELIKKHEKD